MWILYFALKSHFNTSVLNFDVADLMSEMHCKLQECSYLCILPDEFLWKSVVIWVDFERNFSGRTQMYA